MRILINFPHIRNALALALAHSRSRGYRDADNFVVDENTQLEPHEMVPVLCNVDGDV